MSNLFKQYQFVNFDTEKRVINSEQMYTERQVLAGTNVFHVADSEPVDTDGEEELDNFLAGLEAEEVVVDPQVAAEVLLEQVHAEADEILAAAKAESLKLLEDAQREAAILIEQKKEEGYQAGMAKMEAELELQRNRMQQEAAELAQNLQSTYEQKMETLETDIVNALIPVFHKVLGVNLDNKKPILLHLISNTLMNEADCKQYRIHVASDNFKYIESQIEDIKEKVGKDVSLEVISDISLEEDACHIETESGVFDCGIDTQLDSLMKDILSLCD